MMTDSSLTMRIILAALICAVLPAALAAVADEKEATGIAVALGFEQFPRENTCEGADLSPRIEIQGCNATSLAIILEDTDAPSGTFIHWIIWNIPPNHIIPSAIAKKANLSDPFQCRQGLGIVARLTAASAPIYSGPDGWSPTHRWVQPDTEEWV